VQERSARPVYRARILPVQRQHVSSCADGVIEINVSETLPSSANANYFDTVLARPVDDVFDDGIETWDVSAAGQNTDSPDSHELSWMKWINFIVPIEFMASVIYLVLKISYTAPFDNETTNKFPFGPV
jgi:hypothetical protein